jgi:molybdopterin-dependent oxidoreductase alpha subunit
MKLTKQAESAAGAKGIFHALKMTGRIGSPFKVFELLKNLNQKGGTDCPGCAWPDPNHRSKLGEFCENGAKAIAEEAMNANCDAEFFSKHPLSNLKKQTDYWLGMQGRLTQPMLVRKGETHYKPIPWEAAFNMVASQLKSLPTPDDAIFYTSGRTSNEAAFLYQLFVRIFGTNNLPDCSNMCHESSGVALNHTLGIGKGSVKLEDFYKSELILIFGQNPGTNHPRMLSALEKAKANGAKVVVINPLKEAGLLHFKNPQKVSGVLGKGVDIADLYLQVKINEDVSLLKVVLKRLLELAEKAPDILDRTFIEQKTEGFQEFKKEIDKINREELIARAGLRVLEIENFVQLIASRKKIIACWAMGLTQHVNGVDAIQEVVNLLLLKGSIGKPGAGTCPVRGHSNVQGDRTMGIHEKPSREFLDTLANTFHFKPPTKEGVDVVAAIKLMHAQQGKVFVSMGGNFLAAAPDTSLTKEAMENCQMTVHVSTKLNRSHLHHGEIGLILPCLGRTDKIVEASGEQKLTVENSMGIVHATRGNMEPRSKFLLSEPHIIAQIAAKTVGIKIVDWTGLIDNYDRIRDLISKSIKGFEAFNEKLKNEKVFELPNGPREGVFTNAIGKARFTTNALSNHQLEKDELLMMTIRSHDQFNTTIYGLDDRYRGIFGIRKVVLMNVIDIENLGLDANSTVTIYNNYTDTRRQVKGFTIVPYDIPQGCVATYFPECNPLIPIDQTARKSNTPASKSVKVRIRN